MMGCLEGELISCRTDCEKNSADGEEDEMKEEIVDGFGDFFNESLGMG